MKHKIRGRKFKRSSSQRKALLKHLAEAIILNGKIKTTYARAKELSSYVEKIITTAKKQNLSSAKTAHSKLSKEASKKLIKEVAPKYRDKQGGYTRVIKTDNRKGDCAKMSVIEFV